MTPHHIPSHKYMDYYKPSYISGQDAFGNPAYTQYSHAEGLTIQMDTPLHYKTWTYGGGGRAMDPSQYNPMDILNKDIEDVIDIYKKAGASDADLEKITQNLSNLKQSNINRWWIQNKETGKWEKFFKFPPCP